MNSTVQISLGVPVLPAGHQVTPSKEEEIEFF